MQVILLQYVQIAIKTVQNALNHLFVINALAHLLWTMKNLNLIHFAKSIALLVVKLFILDQILKNALSFQNL